MLHYCNILQNTQKVINFNYSSTTALIQKIAKDCSEANDVLNRVQLLEQNAGSKRTRSASSAGDSASLSRYLPI